MKNIRFGFAIVLGAVLLVTAIAGCSISSPTEPLVGKWQYSLLVQITYELNSNGGYTRTEGFSILASQTEAGTWAKDAAGTTITFTPTSGTTNAGLNKTAYSWSYTLSADKNTLTLTDSTGYAWNATRQ